MARAKKTRKSSGGRGSAEAIEKRRVARQLNSLLTDGPSKGAKLDGRTEKRRQRLVKELKGGRSGSELKPIEVVSHVNELLDIGESLSSLKKQGVKVRKTDPSPEINEIVERTQQAYGFKPDAWKMLGLTVDAPAETAKATAKKPTRKIVKKTVKKAAKKRKPR